MARKPMDVQSVIIDASRYSLEAAKKKVKRMGYKVTKVDKPEEGETQEYYRFRQRAPGQFEKFRYHKLKRKKKDGTEEETGVQLVLAKSAVHFLVKAVTRGGKYLKRVPKPGGGFRYIYHSEKHRVAHQAEKMLVRAKALKARAKSLEANDMLAQAGKARDKANMLVKLARQSLKGTGFEKPASEKEGGATVESAHAAANRKERAAHAELNRKFAAGKMSESEMRAAKKKVSASTDKVKAEIDAIARSGEKTIPEQHQAKIKRMIEKMPGPIAAVFAPTKKSFHLIKATGAGRPHKYVRRVALPGGGFRYIYKPEAGRGKVVAPPTLKSKPAREAFKELMGTARITVSEIKRVMRRKPADTGSAQSLTMLWKMKVMDEVKKAKSKGAPVEELRALFDYAENITERMEAASKRRRGKGPTFESPTAKARRRTAAREKWEGAAPGRTPGELGIREAQRQAATKKSTEAYFMDDKLSLAEQEGERIAMAVKGSEETRVEQIMKAVTPETEEMEKAAQSEKKEHAMVSNMVNEKFGKEASVRQAKPGLWVVAHGGKVLGKGKSPMAAYKAAQKSKAQKSFSPEEIAVAAALEHGPGALVKAVLEVPVHGKTKKKSIPDERLLAIFKAHVRTEYRNASRYNEGTNAQSIYDRILSSAEYHHYVEAALGVLEKRKTPFSVDFVKQCIQEIEDAKSEADAVAPEPTEPSSVIASGG